MDSLKLKITGHAEILDLDSGETILRKQNAIHIENFIFAISSAMTNTLNQDSFAGFIDTMSYGNGGVVVDGTGNVIYRQPRVNEISDSLYNGTYLKSVNNSPEVDADNNTTVVHQPGTNFTDIIITSTLDYSEPAGQDALDNSTDQEGDYVFDEIGLISQQGRLLTHLIHHPVQKSGNRRVQVRYTVRIAAG